MLKLYNFERLIEKYSVPFHLVVNTDGHYESGKWIDGEPIMQESCGAIVPMPNTKIYQSGGAYTTKDRQLIMRNTIPKALQSSKVCYKGNLYSIQSETDYVDYADVAVYTLKWISLFDKDGADND